MVVKYITPAGSRIHEPPYTEAEEDEFYGRIGGGPVTVARPAGDKTTNKKAQKSAAVKRDPDPLRQRHKKGGEAREVCHRNHRYLVVDFAYACRDAHPAFGKKFFERWILSGGIMSAFAKRDSSVHSGRRQASAGKMTAEPHSADRQSLL
jgi:hypothetical protein